MHRIAEFANNLYPRSYKLLAKNENNRNVSYQRFASKTRELRRINVKWKCAAFPLGAVLAVVHFNQTTADDLHVTVP